MCKLKCVIEKSVQFFIYKFPVFPPVCMKDRLYENQRFIFVLTIGRVDSGKE